MNDGWLTKAPDKEDEIKTFDGKEWNFCKHHKKWVVKHSRMGQHTSATCRINPKNKNKKKTGKKEVQVNQAVLDGSSASESKQQMGRSLSHRNLSLYNAFFILKRGKRLLTKGYIGIGRAVCLFGEIKKIFSNRVSIF